MLDAITAKRGHKLRMAVALNDLRGKCRRLQAELFANCSLDRWIDMRVRADRAADLSHANALPRLREAFLSAAKFIEHQRQLQSKRDRLRMNAVAAPDHRRHFESPRLTRRSSCGVCFKSSSKNADRFRQLHRQSRIQNIRRGQPLVNPARRRPDRFGDILEKRDDIVICPLLDLGNLRN